MVTKEFKITDPIGLHARPATLIVSTANRFESEASLHFNGKKANLKSIMNVMALGVRTNDHITLEFSGDDEAQALEAVEKVMLDNKLV